MPCARKPRDRAAADGAADRPRRALGTQHRRPDAACFADARRDARRRQPDAAATRGLRAAAAGCQPVRGAPGVSRLRDGRGPLPPRPQRAAPPTDANSACTRRPSWSAESDPPQDGVVLVTLQDLTRLHRAEAECGSCPTTDTATGLPTGAGWPSNSQALAEGSAAVATRSCIPHPTTGPRREALRSRGIVGIDHQRSEARIEAELARVMRGAAVPAHYRAAVCRSADAQLALVLRSQVSESRR